VVFKLHENLARHIKCDIGKDSWTKGATIDFNKRNYVLKFITIQFDAGAVGDVDVRIENEKGRLLPFTAGGGDGYIRAVSSEPMKFYVGVGLGESDTFDIYYKNRASDNHHHINVFMEFVRKGNGGRR